jgi:hypothetical protein
MKRVKTFEGYSILYAILIMILTTSICGALTFLYVNINKQFHDYLHVEKIRLSISSGLNKYMFEDIDYNLIHEYSLYHELEDSVRIVKTEWGWFNKYEAYYKHNNIEYSSVRICGDYSKEPNDISFYLKYTRNPLIINSNVKISGGVIKTPYIKVENRKSSVIAKQSSSKRHSIKFNNKFQNDFTDLYSYYYDKALVLSYNSVYSDTLKQDFSDTSLVLYSESIISLDNICLQDNICIISDTKVLIKSNAELNNIIIIAPFIEVEKNAKISCQLIANDSITIHDNVEFLYPSVISTVNQQNITKIFIGDKAKINGIILLNSLGKTRDNESIIEMGEDSHVIGQVYSSAFFSYHNNIKIEGTLFCNTIRFLSEHTVRDNNISGIEINHSKLPKAFVGLNFFDHDKKEAIIYEFYYETLIKESKGYH